MDNKDKAKQYQKIKQRLMFVHLLLTPVVIGILILTPLSVNFRDVAEIAAVNRYLQLMIYVTLFNLYNLIFDFPLSLYSGYFVERQFDLSNQNIFTWFVEWMKKNVLGYAFSLVLIAALYLLIWNLSDKWWVIAWAGYAAVSYVVGKLFPVFIVPMFYQYSRVASDSLRNRIFDLASRYGLPVENVYSINLSKTTKKANAAFMGMGKTKRVVLSDTLIENFSEDEIEAVVAHELGHFKHRDIWKQLTLGLMTSLIAFWLASRLMHPMAQALNYEGIHDIAAMPLLFFIFYVFYLTLMPIQNGFSRWIERAADRFSLKAFPHPQVFISCMKKLATVNLADPEPNPVIEWFFYDHPAIQKRIQMAEQYLNGK